MTDQLLKIILILWMKAKVNLITSQVFSGNLWMKAKVNLINFEQKFVLRNTLGVYKIDAVTTRP